MTAARWTARYAAAFLFLAAAKAAANAIRLGYPVTADLTLARAGIVTRHLAPAWPVRLWPRGAGGVPSAGRCDGAENAGPASAGEKSGFTGAVGNGG